MESEEGGVIVEKTLKQMFDYQRFAKNPALQSIIDDVHRRYARQELSDDELETLSAAGDPYLHVMGPGKRDEVQ